MKWVSERRFLHFIEDIKNLFAYKKDVPTKVSELDNDCKYAKQSELPTKVSELDNDKGFVTNVVKDLTNYYLKSETYTREEIKQLVGFIPKFSIQPVPELPAEDISVTTVYLLTSGDEPNNLYTEYIYVSGQWEKLGTQKLDLSGYALKSDIPAKLSDLVNDSGFITATVDNLINYYTKKETEAMLSNKANSIVKSEIGKNIPITDSANAKPLNIIPYGASEQKQYEGYQLFDKQLLLDNGGVEQTDGSIYMPEQKQILFYTNDNKEQGQYTVSVTAKRLTDTNCILIYVQYTDGTEEWLLSYDEFATNEWRTVVGRTDINKIVSALYISWGNIGSYYIKDVMCNKGTETKPCEPYTGGQASPNMAYPQEIENAENVEVKVYGKNLLDESTISNNDVSGGFAYHFDEPLFLKGGQTYTVKMYGHTVHPQSLNIYRNNTGIKDLFAYPENVFAYVYDTDTITFTLDEDTYCVIRMWWIDNNNIPPLDSVRTQLELGTVATEYEPHKAEQTLSIPYVLREGDKISYAEGKRVENSRVDNLSDYNWLYRGANNEGNGTIYYVDSSNVDITPIFATHFRVLADIENNQWGLLQPNELILSQGYLVVCTTISTLNEFKSWLSDANVQALVELAEPIETDLTAEDIAQYEALRMNYPNTTIVSDAFTEVEYVADTKCYIDKKFKELETALANTNAQLL